GVGPGVGGRGSGTRRPRVAGDSLIVRPRVGTLGRRSVTRTTRRNECAISRCAALVGLLSASGTSTATAQQPCRLETPPAALTIPHVRSAGTLTADPMTPTWAKAASGHLYHDCTRAIDYPDLR